MQEEGEMGVFITGRSIPFLLERRKKEGKKKGIGGRASSGVTYEEEKKKHPLHFYVY